MALAGFGFVALKVLPGVAEAAAPVLGGVTLRDASDLLALVVLVPTWAVLRSWEGPAPVVVERHAPDRRERGLGTAHSQRGWQGVRAVLATGLPLLGAVVATFTATATSCGPDPAVTQVVAVDGGPRGPMAWRYWPSAGS
ncbi:MAG: hypothetical protein KF703_19135 [Actinobacteria bacterium]|nr:hypothetical protein [Actinomycetota bacterium]